MTIDKAEPFLAWDVMGFIGAYLLVAFTISLIDKIYLVTSGKAEKPKFKNIVFFFMFLRFGGAADIGKRPKIVCWSREFYAAFLVVFLLRGFFIEPFKIPSNSMMPTLLTGDFVFSTKIGNGIKIPILNKYIIKWDDYKRGDVIIFRYPNYEKSAAMRGTDYIKRIIGLPGDVIGYENDVLTVNGKIIEAPRMLIYKGVESGVKMTGYSLNREMMPSGGYDTLTHQYMDSRRFIEKTIPEGHYFVMGDNRHNSSDSRFWGYVPEEYIISKAQGIVFNWDETLKINRFGAID
jgi:signal peptidase I